LLRVVERELNDAAHLFVVDAVDNRGDRDDIHTGVVQILNRTEFYVEKVADLSVFICGIADSIELQISETEPGFRSLFAELGTLGELDAVGCGLNAVVADLAGIS